MPDEYKRNKQFVNKRSTGTKTQNLFQYCIWP